MRVTIAHNKGRQEAINLVEKAADQFLRTPPPPPLQIEDARRSWNGDTMDFSLTGRMSVLRVPIQGKVMVTEKDVIIECELPGMLTKLIPEETIRHTIEQRTRGLLNAPSTK